MNEKQRAYLEELSIIDPPSQKPGQTREERDEECWFYCKIRNLAKDFLADKARFDAEKQGLIALLEQAKLKPEEYEILTK